MCIARLHVYPSCLLFFFIINSTPIYLFSLTSWTVSWHDSHVKTVKRKQKWEMTHSHLLVITSWSWMSRESEGHFLYLFLDRQTCHFLGWCAVCFPEFIPWNDLLSCHEFRQSEMERTLLLLFIPSFLLHQSFWLERKNIFSLDVVVVVSMDRVVFPSRNSDFVILILKNRFGYASGHHPSIILPPLSRALIGC